MIRRAAIYIVLVGALGFVSGGANRFANYVRWQYEADQVMVQAEDELERLGVSGEVVDIAPSVSLLSVGGHVRTDHGTQPFFVLFGYGQNRQRVPVKVTLGAETLLPRADATTRRMN